MTVDDPLGTPVWRLDVADTVADLAWSPTDDRLAVGCSGGEVLVIGAGGEVLERRLRHAAGTSCVAWHAGDVASGGVDGWVDVDGHRERLGGWVSALTSGESGLGVAHGRRVSILGSGSSEQLPATVGDVRWGTGPDAAAVGLVACGHGFVTEFDTALARRREANLAWGGTVEHVDWSPDGRWAAAGTRGTTNYLWSRLTANGGVVAPEVHVHVIPCPAGSGRQLAFDTTGAHLGIATTSGGLAVFDLHQVHPVAGPPGRLLPVFCRLHALAWWPDAPVAVLGVATDSGGGGLLLVRCDDEAAPVGVVDLDAPVAAIAWSPGDRQLAVACADGTVSALPRSTDWDWQDSAARWDVTDAL